MPEEPVFKVTNKMFEMLSDWQNKIEEGTVEDPVAESADSAKSNPPQNRSEKPGDIEGNNSGDRS